MNIAKKDHIKNLLLKLNQQIEKLLLINEEAHQIEIDIIKENIRSLYESIDTFNQHTEPKPVITANAVDKIDDEINELIDFANSQFEENEIEKQIKEQEIVLEEQNEDDKREPEIPEEKEIIEVHKDIEEKLEINTQDEPSAPIKEVNIPTETKENKEEEKIVAPIVKKEEESISKPTKTTKTIHVLDVAPDEEFDEDDSESERLLPSKIKLKPIKSLKSGIGINDKFMITNDLFEGRTPEFNEAIKRLDSLENAQEALYLLGDMKDENLWEIDDNVFQVFKKYVERRYAK